MQYNDVFVSYRRTDVEFVKQLVKTLEANGRNVWVDWEDIPPGVEKFGEEIQRGIEENAVFIAVLSPAYLESKYCAAELQEALRLKKRIIPLVLQKFDPAPQPEGISQINYIYFTPHVGQQNTFEESFPKVIQALDSDYDHAREHTRILNRAINWDKHERERSYLFKGAEIDQAESWQVKATGKTPGTTELQSEFILVSRKEQRAQQRRFTLSIGVFLVLAVIAAVVAIIQANRARINAAISQSNALSSAALQPGNEEIAVALALEATRSKYAPENAYRTLAKVAYPMGGIRHYIKTDENFDFFLSAAVSPTGDSVVIKNHLYDMTTGEMIREFDNTPELTLAGLFMPDGKRVVLAGDRDDDETTPNPLYMGMYDVSTGELISAFDTETGVAKLQLSEDGKTLVSYLPQKAIWWDVTTGKRLREFDNDGSFVTFSPDLKWMAQAREETEGFKMEVVVLDTQTMQEQWTFSGFGDALGGVGEIGISDDSSEIAVYALAPVSFSATLSTYSLETGEFLRQFSNVSPDTASLHYSPDGRYLLTAGLDHDVVLWDTGSGTVLLKQTVHRNGVVFADFVQQGGSVISMDASGTVVAWDVVPGNLERTWLSPNENLGALTPDGKYLINYKYSPSSDGLGVDKASIVVRDAYTQQEVSSFPMSGVQKGLNADGGLFFVNVHAYYFPGGLENGLFCYTMTTSSSDGITESTVLNVARLSDGEIVRSVSLGTAFVIGAEFLPKGNELSIRYQESIDDISGSIGVLDIATGDLQNYPDVPRISNPAGDNYLTTLYNPDNGETTIQLIDDASGDVLFELKDPQTETLYKPSVFFTPDGDHFVITKNTKLGEQKTLVSVYDARSYKLVREYVLNVAPDSNFLVSPDGASLISLPSMGGGGGGGAETPSGIGLPNFYFFRNDSLMQWDILTGEQLWNFSEKPYRLLFSPDGKRMFTQTDVNSIWRFDSHEELVRWACANRYAPEFTTQQRERFSLENDVSICKSLED